MSSFLTVTEDFRWHVMAAALAFGLLIILHRRGWVFPGFSYVHRGSTAPFTLARMNYAAKVGLAVGLCFDGRNWQVPLPGPTIGAGVVIQHMSVANDMDAERVAYIIDQRIRKIMGRGY